VTQLPLVAITRPDLHGDPATRLSAVASVRVWSGVELPTDEELSALLGGCAAVLCVNGDPISAELLDRLPELRLVSIAGLGYDMVDVAAAAERGIAVSNTPTVLSESVADMTIGLMLAARRRIVEADRYVRRGDWTTSSLHLMVGEDLHEHDDGGAVQSSRQDTARATRLRRPRTAVVIGAGQGMGKAVALMLATSGTHVHLVGRTSDKLEATAAEVAAAGGTSSMFPADVSHAGALDALAVQLEGGLDILVNCAGEVMMNSFDDTTFEDWQRVLGANLTTSYVATHSLLPALRKSENASIILVASKVALRGYEVVAYSAAKAGVLGFARALSVALREEGIRVVALCPGPTDTPMRRAASPDMRRDMVISAETIAATVRYIVDLPRGTTTGEILVQSELYD
jgi:NAD(P)-dependent dehydrogenase (short-subunit alcohol dehydrogenase family)